MKLKELTEKVKGGYLITVDEARELVTLEDKQALYAAADDVRRHFHGDDFDTCSIINAKSGRCPEDCKWCAQSVRAKNTGVSVYEFIDKEEAVGMAVDNARRGVRRFSLVTSGRRLTDKNVDKSIEIYEEIASKCDIKLCASMGLLSEEQLKRLRAAGVTHYHCNIETAPSFFGELCTTHTLDEKLETIRLAKKVGFEICCGGILGLGEDMEQRIEMAFFLREMGVFSIPLNILVAIKGTALENAEALSKDEIFTSFAMFRFVNPKAYIRMAGGRIKYKEAQEKALRTGVNASIVGDLLTTTGSRSIEEDILAFEASGFRL